MGEVRRISGDVTLPETPKGVAVGDDRPHGLPSRYRIEGVIGEGGMGKVYRAHDSKLGRDVAIKIIDWSATPGGAEAIKQRERFAREARAAARLAHPNIVAIHDVDAEVGYLVMDLVEGRSLAEQLQGPASPDHAATRSGAQVQTGKSPPALVRGVAEQVLRALDAAHAGGVIHRDVKPSNVIVDEAGKATLVDFGVARLVDAEMTRTGEAIGTPAYMAPEQLRGGAVDERTDLYGLGATLYEMVTGDRMVAFESPGEAAMSTLSAACAVDPTLAEVIGRCLRGEPAARYPSARDALAALTSRPKRRARRALVIGLAIAAVAAAAVLIINTTTRSEPRDRRLDEAFAIAQRGEHEKASLVLDEYLATHPDDAEAWTLKLLVHWWWHGLYDDQASTYLIKLDPEQRAMARGIELLTLRQEDQAIAYLETVAHAYPTSPLIGLALGEARWHGGYLERGVATLEQAYLVDPRWQMALHHVVEYRLSRGEPDRLIAVHAALAGVDRSRAAALACEMTIARRAYAEAAAGATRALGEVTPIPELYTCAAQAYALAGKIELAEATIRTMSERGAIDLREWGGRTMGSELLLYRGRYAEYTDKAKRTLNRQRDLADMLWDPEFATLPSELHPALHLAAVSNMFGMRGPPIGVAMVLIAEHLKGRDAVSVYRDDPQAELRWLGRGLGAELRGDHAAAIEHLGKALAAPSKGDTRMLIGHALARNHHRLGDQAAARAACREVMEPTQYLGYRAVLVPDCVLWGGDRAQMTWLLEVWQGDFAHRSITAIRERVRG